MKLALSRLFDYASIAATKAGPEIRSFVEYVNSSLEQLIRAVAGQLTLADNVKGQFITVSLLHATPTAVAVSSRDIAGLIALKCPTDAIDAMTWAFDAKDQLLITVYYKTVLTKHSCTFFAFFA